MKEKQNHLSVKETKANERNLKNQVHPDVFGLEKMDSLINYKNI